MTSDPTDQRPPPPPGGWRIGRYRVESVLGTGAFATVYRAVDERLEDTVAVKVLAENHSLDPEIRKRFLTEGRVLRRIDSPHVVGVHDLGETDRQQPYLVLQYAPRGTLAQRARELRATGWHPTPADLWAVAEPLARALDAVHEVGVVHRDVNPGNVLLTTRGVTARTRPATVVGNDERIVLADLGLCKDLALHSGHTSAGGTEGFRPPELRGGPAIIDGRADLWSLSALIVWLATGSPPDGAPVGPALAAAGLPPALAGPLDRSLATDPHARHPDPLAWLADIEPSLTAPNPTPDPPPPGPVAPPPGERPRTAPAPQQGVAQDARPAPPPPMSPTRPLPPTPPEHHAPPAPQTPPEHHAPPAPQTPQGRQAPPASQVPQGSPTPPRPQVPPGLPMPPGPPGLPGPQVPPGLLVGPAQGDQRDWPWRLRHSAWLLATLPFGLTAWAGFLYIGWRAQRASWLRAAVAYGAGAVLLVTLAAVAPVTNDGNSDTSAWQTRLGITTMVVLWAGGLVHGLLANRHWLRWRSLST